jgi:hypothetical protein
MDNFTLSVLIGGAALIVFFVVLIVLDKPRAARTEPPKPAGKRTA